MQPFKRTNKNKKYKTLAHWDNTEGKDACHQALWSKFNPQDIYRWQTSSHELFFDYTIMYIVA